MRLVLCATVVFAMTGVAHAQDAILDRLNDTAVDVKATSDPVQKRAILEKRIDGMDDALSTVRSAPMLSEQDAANIDRVKATLQERSDELAGRNGFSPVPDDQLNAFSSFVVQDFEQAKSITIGVVTLLLIIIIIILLV
jgi:hypothetical protein